ncbi:MAG: Sir2 silent information regulator family NAD-dependent deacetylase [Atopobiaceae bacterium]|jgi:NAD-dependent SIR2 family protein deacetylase|nr:Sir2 silent information regulator family NAD-dependent deacetylase [Atopobiaceae bacterium]
MSTSDFSASCERLADAIAASDAVLVGAGAGLSTSSGLAYDGPRFERLFGDFARRYGIRDMYTGGFHPFPSSEERWAWWARHIWYNRYEREVGPAYESLARLMRGRDLFVLTTNVDHCFQDAGFDKGRLFYTQGDYGLWQCSLPCHEKTYGNREAVRRMVSEQRDMRVPTELVPTCPVCGREMAMNLRADDTFVEDVGWHAASTRYSAWLASHATGRVLYLELGVGGNTPGIIKFPFWSRVARNPQATYAVINRGEAYVPQGLRGSSIAVDGDIGEALETVEGMLG